MLPALLRPVTRLPGDGAFAVSRAVCPGQPPRSQRGMCPCLYVRLGSSSGHCPVGGRPGWVWGGGDVPVGREGLLLGEAAQQLPGFCFPGSGRTSGACRLRAEVLPEVLTEAVGQAAMEA